MAIRGLTLSGSVLAVGVALTIAGCSAPEFPPPTPHSAGFDWSCVPILLDSSIDPDAECYTALLLEDLRSRGLWIYDASTFPGTELEPHLATSLRIRVDGNMWQVVLTADKIQGSPCGWGGEMPTFTGIDDYVPEWKACPEVLRGYPLGMAANREAMVDLFTTLLSSQQVSTAAENWTCVDKSLVSALPEPKPDIETKCGARRGDRRGTQPIGLVRASDDAAAEMFFFEERDSCPESMMYNLFRAAGYSAWPFDPIHEPGDLVVYVSFSEKWPQEKNVLRMALEDRASGRTVARGEIVVNDHDDPTWEEIARLARHVLSSPGFQRYVERDDERFGRRLGRWKSEVVTDTCGPSARLPMPRIR